MEVFLLPIQTKSRLHSFVSLTIRLEYENNPSLAIVAMAACPTSLQTSQLQQRCPPPRTARTSLHWFSQMEVTKVTQLQGEISPQFVRMYFSSSTKHRTETWCTETPGTAECSTRLDCKYCCTSIKVFDTCCQINPFFKHITSSYHCRKQANSALQKPAFHRQFLLKQQQSCVQKEITGHGL